MGLEGADRGLALLLCFFLIDCNATSWKMAISVAVVM